jgi:3-dehydroquinate dehydratase-1
METKFDPIEMPDRKPRIVGVVASRADWELVSGGEFSELDLCELRMDLLITEQIQPHEYLKPLWLPKILTIRDPREGGKESLSESERLNLFRELLPHVDYIDIELRNFSLYSGVIAAARTSAKQLIVSVHDFEKTPGVEQMEHWATETEARYPDAIFKISVRLNRWEEMVRIGNFLVNQSRIRVAAMGMGPLGKISRLLFARLGSELTYAACGEVVVPGQWDFRTLRSVLSEIFDGN